ncbi:MAG: hypothetical protein A2Y92_02160 [Chloroflexi bacterium RBG_13_57_8]|nr:MAG: hypothetical protein A2Y92_02160 [Chloroflexi bacterium RBG_13_57_8]
MKKAANAAPEAALSADTEAVAYLKQALASGKHWYLALLGAMGLWTSAEEVFEGRAYRYLIEGEAFDWLLLAERLCEAVDGLLPEEEKNALLFYGIPPLELGGPEVAKLIGEKKYRQYLNFFYGVTVEEALLLAVQEEIDKERRVGGLRARSDSTDEAFLRIYAAPREALFELFRREKSHPRGDTATLTELKEFTYWLFKYRLRESEKARVASDTRKALEFLRRQWRKKGVFKVLAAEIGPSFPA